MSVCVCVCVCVCMRMHLTSSAREYCVSLCQLVEGVLECKSMLEGALAGKTGTYVSRSEGV